MKNFVTHSPMLLLLILVFACAAPLHAATPVVVGTCRSGMPSFALIQDAVNAVSPGGLILVCADTYAEQITIHQPLTLIGVPVGKRQSPLIVPPLSGYTDFYAPNDGPAIFSILIQNAGTVVINNLVVQGNSSCPAPDDAFGVASIDSTTTIVNSAVRSVGGHSANCGTAIYSTGAGDLNVVNTSVHDFFAGIVSYSSQVINISSSTIANGGTGMDLETSTGLVTVSGNTLQSIGCPQCGGGGAGILITGLIPGSRITNNSIGMVSTSGGALPLYNSKQLTVTGNKMNGGSYGIEAMNLSGSVVQANTIVNTGVAIKVADTGTGSNVFSRNIVKETNCGVWAASSTGDIVTGNTFSNATMTTCP